MRRFNLDNCNLRLFKALGINYVFFFVNFVSQSLIARTIGPDSMGEFSRAIAVIGVLDIIGSLSVPMAYIYLSGKGKYDQCLLFNACRILAIVTGLIPAFFALVAHILGYSFPSFYLVLSVLLTRPFFNLANLTLAERELNEEFSASFLIRGLAQTISISIALILVYYNWKHESLILREVLAPILLFFLSKYKYDGRKIILKGDIRKYIKDIFKYCIKLLSGRMSEVAFYKLSLLFVTLTVTNEISGFYFQALTLVTYMVALMNPLTEKISFVLFSKNESKKNLNNILLILISICFPLVVFIYFLGDMVFITLYGDGWQMGADFFVSMAICTLTLPLFNVLKTYCYAKNKFMIVSFAYIIALAGFVGLISLGYLEHAYAFGTLTLFGMTAIYVLFKV